METPAIITAAVALLAVTGVGLYGGDDIIGSENVSGDQLNNMSDNSPISQKTDNGTSLDNEREIKGRDTEEDQNQTEDQKNGIVTNSEPVAGENLRLVVYDQGEKVTGEKIYVNEELMGETSQTGSLTFEVPNKEEITVSTDSDIESITRSVSNYSQEVVNFNMIQPQDGTEINGYKEEIITGIEANEGVDYTVNVNGETVNSSELSENQQTEFKKEIYFEEAGQQEIKLTAENGETTQTEKIQFTTTQSVPPIEANMDNPDEGQEINDYWATFNYNIESSVPYLFELQIDGETVQSTELEEGESLDSYETFFNNPGTHNWSVKAQSKVTDQETVKTKSFQTTEEPPIAEIQLDYPTDNLQGGESFQEGENYSYMFTADVFEDLNWQIYLVDSDGNEQLEFERNISRGQEQIVETQDVTWEAGEYEWYVEATSTETGEQIQTEKQPFEVVP